MDVNKEDFHSLSLLSRVLYVLGIAACLLLGIIGLILPVIPGLVFLFIAAVMLTRVSSRFAEFFQDSRLMESGMRHWRSMNHLSFVERIKLSGLYLAKSVLDGIRRLLSVVAQ